MHKQKQDSEFCLARKQKTKEDEAESLWNHDVVESMVVFLVYEMKITIWFTLYI